MLKPFSLLIVAFITFSCQCIAQLNTIVPTLPTKEALVFTTDGRQVKGKVLTSLIIGGMLKSFSVKDENGTKHEFKAE